MVWTNNVPVLPVDLNLSESRRWDEVISAMKPEALKVVAAASEEMRFVPRTVQRMFGALYQWKGGLYVPEIKSIAKSLGVSTGKAIMLNCAYELSHLYLPRVFGCTAGVRWVEGKGMTHVRTLDWPMPAIGDATCQFTFRNGRRRFVVIGCPGQVGVLSGMVPGGYSVTINWAPPHGWPNFEFGPSFLLRHVLETVDTYAEAVQMLRDTPLSTSVFFTVCGINPGEGCVIERTKNDFAVRELKDGAVVQANHHESAKFEPNNAMVKVMEDAAFMSESGVRSSQLHQGLCDYQGQSAICDLLGQKPVLNGETVQKMVFCPNTGELEVWRLATR
jgi:predicted choloylglycine hydrolase